MPVVFDGEGLNILILFTSKISDAPKIEVLVAVFPALNAKSSVAFELLVNVKVVTAAVWPGITVVVVPPTSATVRLIFRSMTKLSVFDTTCGCAILPTLYVACAVLLMEVPAAVPDVVCAKAGAALTIANALAQ